MLRCACGSRVTRGRRAIVGWIYVISESADIAHLPISSIGLTTGGFKMDRSEHVGVPSTAAIFAIRSTPCSWFFPIGFLVARSH